MKIVMLVFLNCCAFVGCSTNNHSEILDDTTLYSEQIVGASKKDCLKKCLKNYRTCKDIATADGGRALTSSEQELFRAWGYSRSQLQDSDDIVDIEKQVTNDNRTRIVAKIKGKFGKLGTTVLSYDLKSDCYAEYTSCKAKCI